VFELYITLIDTLTINEGGNMNDSKVLAHIAGPSGCGKTTLAQEFSKIFKTIKFKDLDVFDYEARVILGWKDVRKRTYTDEMLLALYTERQALLDSYVARSSKPVIFVGIHNEGVHVLKINTTNRFLLNTDAKTSAMRRIKRSATAAPDRQLSNDDMDQHVRQAQGTIDWLEDQGYKAMTVVQLELWIKH
jgi:hypothetical protein